MNTSVGIGIGIGYGVRVTGGPGFSLTALTLAWSSAASDNTPGFEVSGDSLDLAPIGAKLELWISTDVDFTPPPEEILLEAVSGNPTTLTVVDALTDGAKLAKVRLVTSADVPLTDWSNVVTETIATTSKLLLVAGGTDELLLVDGTSKLLLAA